MVIARDLYLPIKLAVMFSLVFLSFMAFASTAKATTIGTNISTAGTLSVTSTTSMADALTLTATANPQMTVRYDTTNYYTTSVSSLGATTFAATGTQLANVFNFNSTVSIATSTLQTILTVYSTSASNASTTLAVYQAGTGNALDVYTAGTNRFTVKNSGRVGIGTSTPSALLSVGTGNTGTSTIDFGKPCFRFKTENNTNLYYWPSVEMGGFGGWATSTTSCY